ncbi:thiosulfate sulfurtransferase [Gammaproteobacteria bacterium 45_16_T64]|nr:thiosulfate sulfurtransferase [Gammaproteobacteria bacterium 45_16_T64]
MAFQHISVQDFKALKESQPVSVVDIRDKASFLAGHIQDAIHLHQDNLDEVLLTLDMDHPLVVCCYHGNSSQSAADFLNERGFDTTYSLAGGYTAWSAEQGA